MQEERCSPLSILLGFQTSLPKQQGKSHLCSTLTSEFRCILTHGLALLSMKQNLEWCVIHWKTQARQTLRWMLLLHLAASSTHRRLPCSTSHTARGLFGGSRFPRQFCAQNFAKSLLTTNIMRTDSW